ncbi:hypothetical protein IFT47_19165 [Pseudomonas sp. CFBP 13711]|uniref:hypothetical protein n=1 Tax=unclassified Pseudomonas TaxID=196821 RepID=UPI00177B7C51|nr:MULTISPECIES: hypothetical protein [unclassified Pseudomonas]MBD8708751.1 hypothetical protein [Pseudomonas sp. CFBP 13711]MBD8713751.1 hypothetical protein [Pseudomonas sp. CFBP 13715]
MNSEEFVKVVRLVVSDAAAADVVSVLHSPPGRKPAKELVELSRFYNNQNNDDKQCIEQIIKKSVEEAVFGFLCVLDGVRAIEDGDQKGSISLLYEGETTVKLNADGDLHDLYNRA